MRLLQCGNTVSYRPNVETISSLFKCNDKTLIFTLPRHSIAEWDTMANRFYTPQSIHLDAKTWDKQRSDIIALPNTTIRKHSLINALLDLKPLPSMQSRNPHSKGLYYPFLPKYRFLTFMIYWGHTEPLLHLQRFKR